MHLHICPVDTVARHIAHAVKAKYHQVACHFPDERNATFVHTQNEAAHPVREYITSIPKNQSEHSEIVDKASLGSSIESAEVGGRR